MSDSFWENILFGLWTMGLLLIIIFGFRGCIAEDHKFELDKLKIKCEPVPPQVKEQD